MKKYIYTLFLSALLPMMGFGQEPLPDGGLHVDGSHNFMVPVDSLDIRPWAADFTVSFTIDFDSIKDNATTSLLGLRSREWDGTDKADRGTLWVDCINDNDTMYLSYGFRYYDRIEQYTTKDSININDLSGSHIITLVHGTRKIISDIFAYYYADFGYYRTMYIDGKAVSEISIDTDRETISDLQWRETSHFVIGGSLSDALPYSGMLYDFKYYDMALNSEQVAVSCTETPDEKDENFLAPTCFWDFRNMTTDNISDSYSSSGNISGLSAETGDFLSDAFIPVISKDYESFDKDSILSLYYCFTDGLFMFLSIGDYKYSDKDSLWSLEKKYAPVPYDYLIPSDDGKYFNGMNERGELNAAYDVTDSIKIGDVFYGEIIECDFGGFFLFPDTVIDIYYADGRKNIITENVSLFYVDFWARYMRMKNGDDAQSSIFGKVSLNNRYIQGLGWVNNGYGMRHSMNLRMIKNGDKCLYINPLFNGYTALNARGVMPDSVEDAESSPASWHLPSTVASSELVITDNSGKPVCPDKVSVTSISGAVYQCAVRDGGTVDVSSLPQGFYLLTATCGDVTQTLKFIKK